MKRKVSAMVILLLAGCAPSSQIDYETAVKQHLRDPQSAQFSDVTVNVESVCGFVNSKNGFGGYSGKVPFIVSGKYPELAEVVFIEGPSDRVAIEARCLEPTKSKIDFWITEKVIADLRALS